MMFLPPRVQHARGHAQAFDGKSDGKNVAAIQRKNFTVNRFRHLTVRISAERTAESTHQAVPRLVFAVTAKVQA
jgi:hypothetical protein